MAAYRYGGSCLKAIIANTAIPASPLKSKRTYGGEAPFLPTTQNGNFPQTARRLRRPVGFNS